MDENIMIENRSALTCDTDEYKELLEAMLVANGTLCSGNFSAAFSPQICTHIIDVMLKTRTAYLHHSFDMNAGACVSLTMQS